MLGSDQASIAFCSLSLPMAARICSLEQSDMLAGRCGPTRFRQRLLSEDGHILGDDTRWALEHNQLRDSCAKLGSMLVPACANRTSDLPLTAF